MLISDNKISQKWLSLGLPAKVLEIDTRCADFFISKGLVYPLIGLTSSTDQADAEAIFVSAKKKFS